METEFWHLYANAGLELPQTALVAYEAAARGIKELGKQSDDNAISLYQEKQIDLLRELRSLGNPWPVTDLITLGSPLAYSPDLVPNFEERRLDGELPENPPQAIEAMVGHIGLGKDFALQVAPDLVKEGIPPQIPLRNGLFTVTRWTNLYFPTQFGLFGDLVGGALGPLFGNGIRDREVTTGSLLRDLTLRAHVSYWYAREAPRRNERKGDALGVLVDTLDLNGEQLGIPRMKNVRIEIE